MAEERLQKILSRAGVSSRRAAEELILAGRIQINGEVVTELGTRADPRKDVIRVDEQVIAEPEDLVYYVLYKPERVVTTLADPEGRQAVGDLIRRVRERVYPVGRLDYDAEGVLLLTNDGELAHKLTHPRWGVRRTYLAKVKGEPADAVLERMKEGVRLEDGTARAIEATFEKRTPKNTWIKLVVAEGRHHLVKRLCDAVGHPVVRLYRSDYAGVTAEGLAPGGVRTLTPHEVHMLRMAVAKEAPLPPGGRRRKTGPRPGMPAGAVRDPIMGTIRRSPEGGARGGFGFGARPAGGRGGFGARPAFGAGGFGARPAGGPGGFGAPAGRTFDKGERAGGGRFGAPAGRGFGADERTGGGRFGAPAGRAFGPGERTGGGRSGAPAGRGFGADERTGGGRFGAPAGRAFGPGERAGGGRFGAPAGRGFGSAERTGGGRFGAPAGRGFGAANRTGGGRFGAPAGRGFGSAERTGGGFPAEAGGGERRGFSRWAEEEGFTEEGFAPRAPRDETRGGRPQGGRAPSGGGRPQGGRAPSGGGRPQGGRAPSGGGRPQGGRAPSGGGRPQGGRAPSGGGRPQGGRAPAGGGRPQGGRAPSGGSRTAGGRPRGPSRDGGRGGPRRGR